MLRYARDEVQGQAGGREITVATSDRENITQQSHSPLSLKARKRALYKSLYTVIELCYLLTDRVNATLPQSGVGTGNII